MKHAPYSPIWIARRYAARDRLRRLNLRREIFMDSNQNRVSYGGVAYLWYAARVQISVDLPL